MQTTLQDRSLIALSGEDVCSFLQGIITQDVAKLADGKAAYAALLTPQGKVLFDFILSRGHDTIIYLDCLSTARPALAKRLSMYRLRAKVSIDPADDLSVVAGWDEATSDGAFADPRLPDLGWRKIGRDEATLNSESYLEHRLAIGVPEGSDFGSDRMFALDAGLDELHAIAFDKGCYVGQELTARMKHRGTARKRLLRVESVDGSFLQTDAEIKADGKTLGEMTSAYGAAGFALVRLDRLEEAGAVPLEADGKSIRVTRQNWLSA